MLSNNINNQAVPSSQDDGYWNSLFASEERINSEELPTSANFREPHANMPSLATIPLKDKHNG